MYRDRTYMWARKDGGMCTHRMGVLVGTSRTLAIEKVNIYILILYSEWIVHDNIKLSKRTSLHITQFSILTLTVKSKRFFSLLNDDMAEMTFPPGYFNIILTIYRNTGRLNRPGRKSSALEMCKKHTIYNILILGTKIVYENLSKKCYSETMIHVLRE